MTRNEEVKKYFDELLRFTSDQAQEIIPDNFTYETGYSNGMVFLEIQGPRLGPFLFALGGEIAEVKYDGKFHSFVPLGHDDEGEELKEFLQEALVDLVRFIESDQQFTEQKTLLFRKNCFRIQLSDQNLVLIQRR